jgi:hypothetical protein
VCPEEEKEEEEEKVGGNISVVTSSAFGLVEYLPANHSKPKHYIRKHIISPTKRSTFSTYRKTDWPRKSPELAHQLIAWTSFASVGNSTKKAGGSTRYL